MNQMGIITLAEKSGEFYKEQIQFLFDNKVEVQNFSFEKNNVGEIKNFNVVLVSTSYQHEQIKDYLSENTNVVIGKVTLSRYSFNMLKERHYPTKAMFVNQNLEMCIESISLIYSMGFKNFEFVPVYPGIENVPDLDIAFTVGEVGLVPDTVKEIVDLGDRILDKNTIVELAYALSMEYILSNNKIKQYFDNAISTDQSVELLLGQSNALEHTIVNLLDVLDKGVILINKNQIITKVNDYVLKKFPIARELVEGKVCSDVFPDLDFSNTRRDGLNTDSTIFRFNKNIYGCSVHPIEHMDELNSGFIVIVEDFKTTERKQNSLRLKLLDKGHIAKYCIDDIKYKSKEMEKVVEVVRKVSLSEASVLIMGESGTGKELLAQSIHNISSRRNSHFIAINCAALPESILESELFGYMPGTFTGALSKGKIGIFEMANNGTLFLDEIGDLSLNLQSRLLRVLQEREIMRLGGDEIIPVNIRVLAATNNNLIEKVKRNEFRKDLFYRLNVLPLRIPPLRERKEDVQVLIDYFKNSINASFTIMPNAWLRLNQYNWEGNVREVENCVEYLNSLQKECIDITDLPYHILESSDVDFGEVEKANTFKFHVPGKLVPKLDAYLYVLKILKEFHEKRVHIGRKALSEIAAKDNKFVTEYELRYMLKTLSECGFVYIGVGREGTRITESGIEFINTF